MLWAATLAAASDSIDRAALLEIFAEEAKVEAATLHEISLIDAPAHVTVITHSEIERFGYVTLAEILADEVGFFARDDLNYIYVGVRGFAPFGDYGSHVLLMIDGHPLLEPILGSTFYQRNQPIDLRNVERIEIIRGPGSALYGTNAVLAVINIVTRKPVNCSPIEISLDGSTNGGVGVSSVLSRVSRSGYHFKIGASVSKTEGLDYYFKEFDEPPHFGKAEGLDEERTWSFHSFIDKGRLSFRALFSRRQKHIPTASWGSVFGDSRLVTTDDIGFVETRVDLLRGDLTRLTAKISADWYYYKGIWPYDEDGEFYVFEDPCEHLTFSTQIRLTTLALSNQRLIFGIDGRYTSRAHLEGYDREPEYYSCFDITSTDKVISAFAQDEISLIHDQVPAIVGLRYDDYGRIGGILNPRVGLGFRSRLGKTKLLYGKSFRAPTLYERYYDDTGGDGCDDGETIPNPCLGAETAHTCELVHHTRIGNLRATLSLFSYTIHDLIQAIDQGDGCLSYVNSGDVTSRGLEAEIGGTIKGIDWSFGYSLVDIDMDPSASSPMSFPETMANLKVLIPFGGRNLTLGLISHYIGRRKTKLNTYLKGIIVTDLALYSRCLPFNCSLSISANNVFNANHVESAGPEHIQETLPQDKRRLSVRVSWGYHK